MSAPVIWRALQPCMVAGVYREAGEVFEAPDGDYAPDVVTLDIEMPRMNGLDVLKNRSRFAGFPKVLMLSSLTSVGAEMTRQAMQLGADDFMPKPAPPIACIDRRVPRAARRWRWAATWRR